MRISNKKSFATLIVLGYLLDTSSAVVRRCFKCRSRGELGDCRDPFYLTGSGSNATTAEMNKPGVERQSMDAQQTELYRARQRSRNKVLALILGALAVLFFAITIVQFG